MEWPADHVERWPITRLTPFARNARTHSDAQIAQIAASMREWGWTNPVLVAEDGTIIAGHGRLAAAQRLGWQEAPVMVAHGWTAAQRRAYALADNQLALNARWDNELLALEVGELRDLGADIGLLGFSDAELDALRAETGVIPPAPDAPVGPITPPTTRRGDVWVLGKHRVLCGDSRDADDVATVIAGRSINVAFTSPPYAEQREYDATSGFRPIPPDEYVDWFAPVANAVAMNLALDGSWFINIKPGCDGLDTYLYVFDLVIAHVRQWGWHFATEFCWERGGVPKSVTQRFKNQFEPVYQFTRGRWKMRPDSVRHFSEHVPRAAGPGVGDTNWANSQGGNGAMFGAHKRRKNGTSSKMSSVQGVNASPGEEIGPGMAYPGNRLPTFSGSQQALGHTASFPVGLPEFFIKAYSDPGDVVFDPFTGAGSTLIAADRTGRLSYGLEISPAYVDVAVKRWQEFTGKAAVLDGDGRTFAEVHSERTQAKANVAEAH